MASKQQIIETANDSARQLGYEKLKDLQLEVVIGIVSGQDVFATFSGALAVFDACKTLDSSFHTEKLFCGAPMDLVRHYQDSFFPSHKYHTHSSTR